MKLHYLFSKNRKIGSRMISWGTSHLRDESVTPSHIALLVNERWVFESTLESGVRIIKYSEWLDINQIVDKIECTENREYSEIKTIFKSIQDKKYDWMGVLYFSWWLLLNKFLGIKIPSKNKWESSDKYFCTEAVAKLLQIEDHGMKAPIDILAELRDKTS